jgi:hypothetical protein
MPWFTIVVMALAIQIVIRLSMVVKSKVPPKTKCPVCRKEIPAILANKTEQDQFCYNHVLWLDAIERLEHNYLDQPIDWTLHNVFFNELAQKRQYDNARVAYLDTDYIKETITIGDGGVITVYENGLKTWRKEGW